MILKWKRKRIDRKELSGYTTTLISGKYEMSLTINGLQMPNGREQGDASPTDRTRNGIASGSVQITQ